MSAASDGGTAKTERHRVRKAVVARVNPGVAMSADRPDPDSPAGCREFVIRARHGSELLFELRSRDPRDLLQIIWSKVKGIKDIELAVEDTVGGQRNIRETRRLVRNVHLYDDLLDVSRQWLRVDQRISGAPPRGAAERQPPR